MNKINLDKICAEYGIDLLKKFSDLTFDDLKDSLRRVKDIVDNYKYNSSSNFDRNKVNEYKREIKSKIEEIGNQILNDEGRNENYKYLLKTWFLPELESKLLSIKEIKEIEKEKERIQKLINNCCNFNFSSSNFETEITKALGILVEDGPFAYMIWLKSQDKEPHRAMLIQTAGILHELKLINKIETNKDLKQEIEQQFINLSENLSKLLFAKTILEKMLIYARYKVKAMQHK